MGVCIVDNGANWTEANIGLNELNAEAFAFVGSNIIAGNEPSPHNYGGIYLSKDNGASWSLWNDGMSPGSYNITGFAIKSNYIYSTNGISGVWKRNLSDLTGVAEISDNNKISIFPNPANDNFTIEAPQKSEIEILSIQGQLIKTIAVNGNEINIDVSSF